MEVQTEYRGILSQLFLDARDTDEFEFCCVLLRLRGLQSRGWDSLVESRRLVQDVTGLLNAPLQDEFKLRMLFLLYCHVCEMNDLYSIVANLLRIVAGERYVIDPFHYELSPSRKPAIYPEQKVERITQLAESANRQSVSEIYKYFLVKEVRNAFYHSDYTFDEESLRIVSGGGVIINSVMTREIPFDWLIPRMQTAINVLFTVLDLMSHHRSGYREKKIIKGRILNGDECDEVTLLVNSLGLAGFQA
ncbi:hypothetical protein [Alicyclobacillus dauci]|uniref:Apea-like HEPN domain-containing protein n=1 Tax=Alicyclobacillus dauci TaxID=1475485 RepID=A0ABY6Z5M9_9BACL|nr:hypothetical protein [Alicyclobacillus dauci]WAH38117.1 hypothetical protein NZD86_06410 [Alicyclobacillus dauci]